MDPSMNEAPLTPEELQSTIQEGEQVLAKEAALTAKLLIKNRESLVLAESCTGGLIAASLARTPGISQALAGSFVVYQPESKVAWLNIPKSALKRAPDSVSDEIAGSMALSALEQTPHATISAAITGRLGPSKSKEDRAKDGHAWIALVRRAGKGTLGHLQEVQLAPHLTQLDKMPQTAVENLRRGRQIAAAIHILRMVRSMLTGTRRTTRKKKGTGK
jgi:PncC family amidohydrolase